MPGDMSNVREDGTFPPAFDHVAIVDGDRVQQPGTLMRDPHQFPQQIEREQRQNWTSVRDRASDKFAVPSLLADQKQAYQLLPANENRKSAVVVAFGGPIMLGTQEAISNMLGTVYVAGALFPNVFLLPASTLLAPASLFVFEYTSKQGLYVAAVTATQAQVQCFVDMFDSGTPIT